MESTVAIMWSGFGVRSYCQSLGYSTATDLISIKSPNRRARIPKAASCLPLAGQMFVDPADGFGSQFEIRLTHLKRFFFRKL